MTLPLTGGLPFTSKYFSLITCFQVLHHIEEVSIIINELYRVLKSGGIVVLREHDAPDPKDKMLCDVEHAVYELVLKDPPDVNFLETYYAWYHSRSKWITMMERAGFRFINYKYPSPRNNPTKYFYSVFIKV